MHVTQQLILPYIEGKSVIFTDANLQDFALDENSFIQKELDILQQYVKQEYGMLTLQYSLSTGIHFDRTEIDADDLLNIDDLLRQFNLESGSGMDVDEGEFAGIIRSIFRLCRNTRPSNWSDGRTMRILFLFHYTNHLLPHMESGYHNENQLIAIELAHQLAHSMDVRVSQNYIIFNGRTSIDQTVSEVLPKVTVACPNEDQKLDFAAALFKSYRAAVLEEGLTIPILASLTANTPNHSLEKIARASHRTASPITYKIVSDQRAKDIVEISEGTLEVLNTKRVEGIELAGQNTQVALDILLRAAKNVQQGNLHQVANILLLGAPGTGKTNMALIAANESGLPFYSLVSPKKGIVGATEQAVRLQHQILNSHKNIAFSDEITEALSTSRKGQNLDSGASSAVIAGMLTFLSDRTRQGKQLFIGTSNCGWRMSSALLKRFITIPVLMPLAIDYPKIIHAVAKSIEKACVLDRSDKAIQQAAKVFFGKGASPREIVMAINEALCFSNQKITPNLILDAAENLAIQSDSASSRYADLWALKLTSNKRFLPWYGNKNYQFPEYLQKMVDGNGNLLLNQIEKELQVLEPHVNI
ncbi:MAG: AAA family ATPase [Flammeovirgaceae bacterium]